MQRNKDLFLELREAEEQGLLSPVYTKKKCAEVSKTLVAQVIEDGRLSPEEAVAQLSRISEIVTNALKDLKPYITENNSVGGVTFTKINGRRMPQYETCDVYAELKRKLKDREELLKAALNSRSEIYDEEGVQVPKVPVKYTDDAIQIRF
jgi:hypothetical protein